MSRTNERSLSSKAKAIWLSLVSWMHWRRRRETRRLEEHQQQLLERELQRQVFRMLLLEALVPMAEAMQRLSDNQEVLVTRQGQLAAMLRQENPLLQELKELQLEILNSLQEPVEDQIFQQLGQ